MKNIQEIEKLSAEELLKIGADNTIPVPEDLHVTLPARKFPLRVVSAAAAIAIVAGLGWIGMDRYSQPKDTFDDPYEAYAAVEQMLAKVSSNINDAAKLVEQSEEKIDKVSYWK